MKASMPRKTFPWLVMGDFNAILSLNDKRISYAIRR